MKKNQKTLMAILLTAMLSLLICIPSASAESLYEVSFTPPAGFSGGYNADRDDFRYNESGTNTYIQVYKLNENVENVKDWTDMEWLDWLESFYGSENMHGNMIAYFENIGGYDYVKMYYGTFADDGVTRYYNTVYIGGPKAGYGFYYASTDPSKPYHQEFVDMICYATFSPAVTGGSYGSAADGGIKIYVNGSRIISDADPLIINGRTLVPIRAVAEAMGCTVDWYESLLTVRISRDILTVDIIVDDTTILKISGSEFEEITADVPAQIINDRTYVPVRVVSEAFGAAVNWDENTQSVYITQ